MFNADELVLSIKFVTSCVYSEEGHHLLCVLADRVSRQPPQAYTAKCRAAESALIFFVNTEIFHQSSPGRKRLVNKQLKFQLCVKPDSSCCRTIFFDICMELTHFVYRIYLVWIWNLMMNLIMQPN